MHLQWFQILSWNIQYHHQPTTQCEHCNVMNGAMPILREREEEWLLDEDLAQCDHCNIRNESCLSIL